MNLLDALRSMPAGSLIPVAWIIEQLEAEPVRAAAPATPEPDRLLTAAEAAERLGVDRRWLYRRRDKLPFVRKIGPGTLRFSERALERWKESRR